MKKLFIVFGGLLVLSLIIMVSLPLRASGNYPRYSFSLNNNGLVIVAEDNTDEVDILTGASDALSFLRVYGVGIANDSLKKIPLAKTNLSRGADSDADGLSDRVELSMNTNPAVRDSDNDSYDDYMEVVSGYDPLVPDSNMAVDAGWASKHLGRIFLQVESRGEAWYVNGNGKRYFLGSPEETMLIFKGLAEGREDMDLSILDEPIKVATPEPGALILPGPINSELNVPVALATPTKTDLIIKISSTSVDCGVSDIAGQMKLYPAVTDFVKEYAPDEAMTCFGKKLFSNCLLGAVDVADKKGVAKIEILGQQGDFCWLRMERTLADLTRFGYCAIDIKKLVPPLTNNFGSAAAGWYYAISYGLAGAPGNLSAECALSE